MNVSPRLMIIASWRLVSELHRRAPNAFNAYETHPCSGMYDCLSVFDKSFKHIADFNRGGSLHFHERLDGRESPTEPMHIWERMVEEQDPRELLDYICDRIGIDVPHKLPPSTPTTLVYRFIAEFLSHSVFGLADWDCRNGFCDTSGYGGGRMGDWFDDFPQAKERLREALPTDGPFEPAYRFWFLVRDWKPLVCLETVGTIWTKDGKTFDLPKLYAKKGRRLWLVIMEVAGDLLP